MEEKQSSKYFPSLLSAVNYVDLAPVKIETQTLSIYSSEGL